MMSDPFQTKLNAKNLPYIVFGTVACVCMLMYAYACIEHMYVELECAYANACMRAYTSGFCCFSFPKIVLFSQK